MADFSCTFSNCDRVFSKAYELRKHKATHEDPDRVFHCSMCDFITLQKKSLAIHFAIHTGEKVHRCPEYLDGPSGLPPLHCDYRTNDPAALSKHRKKVHGYIPPPNRSRLSKADPAAPRKPREDKDENITRRCWRPQRSTSLLRRRPSRVPRTVNYTSSIPGCVPISAENTSTFLCQGNVPMEGDAMDVECYGESSYDFSGAALVDFDDEMRLDRLYDPSLCSQWMAEYEAGYSTFEATGMKYLPEFPHVVSSSSLVGYGTQTGREGCLCPEWMIEAGIEGWDQSVIGDVQGEQ